MLINENRKQSHITRDLRHAWNSGKPHKKELLAVCSSSSNKTRYESDRSFSLSFRRRLATLQTSFSLAATGRKKKKLERQRLTNRKTHLLVQVSKQLEPFVDKKICYRRTTKHNLARGFFVLMINVEFLLGIYEYKIIYWHSYRIYFQAWNVDSQDESVVVIVGCLLERYFDIAWEAFDCLDLDVASSPWLQITKLTN